jgi:hypothetical protein
MSKTLMVITSLLFVGAMSDFVKQDPVVYHVPGQAVTINEVLATMTTSYMLHHAPDDRQFLYVVFSALPIGLACLWGVFDRRQARRPKVARVFGGLLFVMGSGFAGMLPAFSAINPTNAGSLWHSVVPGFVLAAVFLAASWPLCFRLRLATAISASVPLSPVAADSPTASCPNCNALQPSGASFCYQCGAPLQGRRGVTPTPELDGPRTS